jgi:hypothetical protein
LTPPLAGPFTTISVSPSHPITTCHCRCRCHWWNTGLVFTVILVILN